MAQEENPSKFNGLILEIAGKGLIQHSYSEQNNQHQIAIGLPQLDKAVRQIKLSQYDSAGNIVKEIDLTTHNSIEIVEIRQQPTTARQKEDINFENVLSRDQPRLSDFYQSYRLKDSSIDWSKIATRITLPNTSGIFYDHEDKYTVGFKIELSPQGVETIEFRDGTGETIATFSYAQQFYTDMVIGNLCQIDLKRDVGDSLQGTFCSPTVMADVQYLSASNFVWSLCQKCGVLYNNDPSNSCFAGGTHNPMAYEAGNLMTFAVPYYPNNTSDPTGGSGYRCTACQALYDPQSLQKHCPAGGNHTNNGAQGTFYWPILDTPTPNSGVWTFNMCGVCSGLYYVGGYVSNACHNSPTHTPATINECIQMYYLTVLPKP